MRHTVLALALLTALGCGEQARRPTVRDSQVRQADALEDLATSVRLIRAELLSAGVTREQPVTGWYAEHAMTFPGPDETSVAITANTSFPDCTWPQSSAVKAYGSSAEALDAGETHLCVIFGKGGEQIWWAPQ